MNSTSLISQAWPDWIAVDEIGQGAYGTVYDARHTDIPGMDAAVKVIPVPADESEIDSLRKEGFTEAEIADFFRKMADDWSAEILMLKKYQGMSHFVSIEDCRILDQEERKLGKWILIRMEKLKSFSAYISDKTLSEAEVIQLGMQLCEALAVCHADGILHRDIKPDNIFVNDRSASGVLYKLGDFGVARQMGASMATLTIKGALGYMAPEIIQGKPYDHRVDIYSLGLTLYKLMNGNRLPFLPGKRLFTHEDHAIALRMRLNGIPIPPISNASPALNKVLLKACAFRPAQRFSSAREFSSALGKALKGKTTLSLRFPALRDRNTVRRAAAWLGAALILAGLVFGAVRLQNRKAGEVPAGPRATEVPMLTVIERTKE